MATGPPTLLLQVNTSSPLQQMTGFLPEESPSKRVSKEKLNFSLQQKLINQEQNEHIKKPETELGLTVEPNNNHIDINPSQAELRVQSLLGKGMGFQVLWSHQ